MGPIDLAAWPVPINLVVFVAGAVLVWRAGSRLARYADAIADRTGAGEGFIGALLLGGLTSLPEIATTLTASLGGNAPLAVNNLFGGVAMQVAVLAGIDLVVRQRALSSLVDRPVVMMQAALSALLLVLATVGMVLGEVRLGWFGSWSLLLFLVAAVGLYLAYRYERSERWTAPGADPEVRVGGKRQRDEAVRLDERARGLPGRRLAMVTALAGLAILIGGFAVARSGDAIAQQTGLGSSFVGAVLVAIATSLPEISTTYAAILLGNPRMAFSNIFGTNIFDVAILFLADVAYLQGPVLNEVGRFSQVAALLGVVVTLLYLAGLLLRAEKTVVGMGVDSLVVLAVYLGGVMMLYTLRSDSGEGRSGSSSAPHVHLLAASVSARARGDCPCGSVDPNAAATGSPGHLVSWGPESRTRRVGAEGTASRREPVLALSVGSQVRPTYRPCRAACRCRYRPSPSWRVVPQGPFQTCCIV